MIGTASARIWLAIGLAGAAIAATVLSVYFGDMNRITQSLTSDSELIMTKMSP